MNFKNISEFNDYFKDEKICYQFLEMRVWGGVPVCPHCATAKKPYNVKARGMFKDIPSYRCSERACDLPFTVRTGSIYEGSKVELRKWLQASYELGISKKGISSVELGTRIGVSQKTAWFMLHRLRSVLPDKDMQPLSGIIEADESFFGGKEANKHKSKRVIRSEVSRTLDVKVQAKKTIVLGLLERNGKVRTFVVPNREAETLQNVVRTNVAEQSRVITDALTSYVELKDVYNHISVKHTTNDYITHGDKHTNGIENFWSLMKRGIIGTFHFVSPQHLHRYCEEFAYRFNNRKNALSFNFSELITKSNQARLTYHVLTGKNIVQ